ncbi:PREDICTED: membrane-spanning 4-domains subfamily A member 6A-like [Chrysochloris asiatica]|uniref:Membrane-spanning 4-domains subfamily A member 6A-like n=1 Tax=Chrysochloris asiatica TaxID=185453 RepID=A0A9B0UC65_CHRAS|nr:PREDICTED: membrane-spanning 4-domains subfamily A member 6A-like [Chrysochloris asiatica]
MISQHMPNDSIIVLTPNGIQFPQSQKPNTPNQKPENLMKCLKTEIQVFGTIQILCGLMVLSLGLILVTSFFSAQYTPVFSNLLKVGYPFFGAFSFIISGSLSIITEKKSIKCLVKSSLIANILSCLCAVVGFILLSISLAGLDHASQICEVDKEINPTGNYYHSDNCSMATTSVTLVQSCMKDVLEQKQWNSSDNGVLSLMLIFTVLEFCLAVLATVLWRKHIYSGFSGVSMLAGFIEIALNIGTNIISTVISSIGITLLSVNLCDLLFFKCSVPDECLLAIPFTTVSAVNCLNRSDAEGPYQDILTQPAVYEDLQLQDTHTTDNDP